MQQFYLLCRDVTLDKPKSGVMGTRVELDGDGLIGQ
jgi:hypothetical protein